LTCKTKKELHMKSSPIPFCISKTFIFVLMFNVLVSTNYLFGQQINPKILEFDKICAGGPHPTKPGEFFNEYQASFSITGFATDVSFKVELSDPSGSFVVPTSTTNLAPLPVTPPDTATDKTLVFAVPTNLIGSNSYRLRVVSSNGIASQSFTILGTTSTKNFPAYYKAFSGPFAINNNQQNVSFCFGGSVTLAVYNSTPSIPSSSPANYPQLKYIWFKDDVVISGQTSSSLTVNTTGVFYAKLDYGLCSDDNFSSQPVTVSGATGASSVIVSSAGNPFCSNLSNTTLSISNGNSYVWKKDNAVISGATSSTYVTNLPGIYTCVVDYGGCKSTGTIDLKVFENNNTISGVTVDVINFITEGETLNVTLTTDATAPTYQWLLNDVAIPGAITSSLGITDQGKYKAIITQTSGCTIIEEFPFEISFKKSFDVLKISNILTPAHSWIIPEEYTGGKAKIMILSSLGEIVFESDNYDNYNGWPQTSIEFNNFNPVYYYIITPNGGSAKKGSITLVK
jgi:hypothetical protein